MIESATEDSAHQLPLHTRQNLDSRIASRSRFTKIVLDVDPEIRSAQLYNKPKTTVFECEHMFNGFRLALPELRIKMNANAFTGSCQIVGKTPKA